MENDKFKIVCGVCGSIDENLTIKEASEKPCSKCGSYNTEIYGQETNID